MASETAQTLIERARIYLGGPSTATKGQWPDADMVAALNEAIRTLQNVMDVEDKTFLTYTSTLVIASTSPSFADSQLTQPVGSSGVRRVISVQNCREVSNAEFNRITNQALPSSYPMVTGNGIFAQNDAAEGGSAPAIKRVRILLPSVISPLALEYSFYHALITTGNMASQNILAPAKYYPLIEKLTAAHLLVKHQSESQRLSQLLQLIALEPLPNGTGKVFGQSWAPMAAASSSIAAKGAVL